jgi:hypothetical protein
MPDN